MPNEYEWVFDAKNGFKKNELKSTLKPRQGEVLIEPKFVGICGTDLFLMSSGLSDLRLGHEWVGEVTALGPKTTGFKLGDLATGTGHFACGKCSDCKRGDSNLCAKALHFSSNKIGALRSSFVAPVGQIQKMRSSLHRELVLNEVFAVGEEAHHLLKGALSSFKPGRVLIFGAGPIGLAIALALKSHGIKCLVVEKLGERVKKAQALKLQAMSLAEAMMSPQMDSAFSILVDASNDYSGDKGAFRLLQRFATKRFCALIVGKYTEAQSVSARYNSMAGQLIWMRGVSNRTMTMSVRKWTPKLKKIGTHFISHTYRGADCAAAFERAADKQNSMKVVIEL
jgi:threonine dehydrogenase-like Zn-dependent dehydrogenase